MHSMQKKIWSAFLRGVAIFLFCHLNLHAQSQLNTSPEYRVVFPNLEYKEIFPKLTKADTAELKTLFDSSEVVRHVSTEKAIIILERALKLSKQKRFVGGVGHALTGLAICYFQMGDIDKAKQALKEAWPYCYAADNDKNSLKVNWFMNMSGIYAREGNFEQAHQCLSQAMTILQQAKEKDPINEVMLYVNIAGVLHKTNSPDKALYYLRKGEAISQQIKVDDFILAKMYELFGLSYDQQNIFDTAQQYYFKAISIASGSKKTDELQSAYVCLGNMHYRAGNMDTALFYLAKGMQLANNVNPVRSHVAPNYYLSKIYLAKKNYHLAERYAFAALEILEVMNNDDDRSHLYNLLATIYGEMGQYKREAQYLRLYSNLNDSLLNVDKQRTISELDIKYRTSEKDKELARQSLLLVNKELTIWAISIGALLLIVFLISLYWYQRRLQGEKINNLEKDQEIKRLHAIMEGEEHERSRIAHELHDGIVSQLTAVKLNFSRLLQQEQPDKAAFELEFKYLDETMQDLRKTAHNLMPETVMKSGLINSLKDFCRKMDNENLTRIQFLTSGELPKIELPMALSLYRMVQELVQNALKHAKARNLLVQFNCHDGLIDITVEDDGIGFNEEVAAQKGTGLYHIRQRVAAMKGHIEFISSGAGATVYTEIPIPA